MRVRVLSDLHLEFMGGRWLTFINALPVDCDVLVLAGDITSAAHTAPPLVVVLQAFCGRFSQVVFVPGNHEYYGAAPASIDAIYRESNRANLHWLRNSAVSIDGVRFIGGSLWFRYPEFEQAKSGLSDYFQIGGFEPWVYDQSAATRLYLHENLRRGDVLVTHHLPSHRSVHPKYANSPLNQFFVCDIEDMIQEREPTLAIHGHTHESCDYRIGPTRVVCNPYGYYGHAVNGSFDPAKTIEVDL